MADYIKLDADFVSKQIDRLMSEYALEFEGDDALREDMISGSTNLDEVVSRALDHAIEAETMAEAVKARLGFMTERKARYDRRAQAMRGLILEMMNKANLRSLPLPEASITVSAGRDSVVITDEASVPRQLGKSTWAPDKKAIGDQLKAGVDVPGAVIQTGKDTLRVSRT